MKVEAKIRVTRLRAEPRNAWKPAEARREARDTRSFGASGRNRPCRRSDFALLPARL